MKRKYNWANHFFNFLAVILGVYLAFNLNERAKIRQDMTEADLLMKSLVNDLSEDIKTYEEYQIPVNKQLRDNVQGLLNSLMADSLDDLDSQLSAIFEVENYAPTTSTYSSMKSAGKLSLIDDLALQKKLSDYYEGLVFESQKKGDYQVDYFTSELLSWLANNFDLMDVEISKEDDLVVLRNKLLIYESLVGQKVDTYEKIVSDSRELKEQIESMLDS